ncbi:putative RNA helicase [Helianthus annuus]|nr:putative RNA helicase [Helianthus annuus]
MFQQSVMDGRGYNVQIFYVEEPVSDYLRATVSTVMSIHDKEPMGVILVFLTRQDDFDTAVQLITEEAQNSGKSSLGLIVLPLYSGLTRADQRETKGGDLNQYSRDIPDVRVNRLCC